MAKKITNKRLVDDKLFAPAKENTDAWIKSLEVLQNQLKDIAKIQGNILKAANAAQAKGIRDITNTTKDLLRVEKEVAQVAQQKERLKQQELRTQQQVERTNQAQIRTTEAQVRQQKRLERDSKQLNSVYAQQSKNLNDLRRRYKDLALQNRENTREGQKLLRNITVLDARLKSIDRTVGQNQREVGNYSSAFRNLGGQLGGFIGVAGGVTAAIAAVSAGIKAAIGLFTEFGLAIAKVAAVSGATEEQLASLTDLAKDLGQSTQFTASQVAGLQLELSKLGLDPSQIEDSTEAILNFAVATDSELSQAGVVVASTLNAFNLEFSEAARVADIAAKAFSSSALDIGKFETALSIVGATANTAGVSIEETTAILGALVDSGVDASSAATGLRKVFSVASKENRNYRDLLREVLNDTNQLSKANELFGLTAQSQAVIIANNIGKVDELTSSFENAEGAAAAAAETIGDTLDGDIKKLQSAVEGAVLNGSKFEGTFRKVVQFLTKALPPVIDFLGEVFGIIIDSVSPVVEGIGEVFEVFSDLFKELGLVSEESNIFVESIRFALLPLKLLGQALKVTVEGIKSLIKFGKGAAEFLSTGFKRGINIATNLLKGDFSGALNEVKLGFNDLKDAVIGAEQSVTDFFNNVRKLAISFLPEQIEKAKEAVTEFGKEAEKTGKNVFNFLVSPFTSLIKFARDKTAVKSLAELRAELNKLQKVREELNPTDLKAIENTKNQISALEEQIEKLEILLGIRKKVSKDNEEQTKGEKILAELSREQAEARIEAQRGVFEELSELRREDFETEEDFQEARSEILERASRENRAIEIEFLRRRIKAAKDTGEDVLALTEELNNLLLEQNNDYNDKLAEQNKKAREKEEEAAKKSSERLQEIVRKAAEFAEKEAKKKEEQKQKEIEDVEQALELTGNFIDAFNKKRLADLDEQEKQINQRQEELRARFEAGNDAAGDSLAELDKRQAELRKERERELERQKRTELGLAALNAYTANLQQNPETALQDTFRDVLALSSFLTGLEFGNFHGTDDTGNTGPFKDQFGAITGYVHENEQVWSKKDRSAVGWRDRDEIKSIVHDWENMNMTDFDTVPIPVSRSNDNRKIIQKFDELKNEVSNLKNHMPQTKWSYDEMGKAAVEEIRSKSKVERNHYKIKGIWGGK